MPLPDEATLSLVDRDGERDRQDHLGQHLPVQCGDAEAAVAGAFVVLEHGERRPSQRSGFLGFERVAVELLGQVGGDHLEDPSAQDPQCFGVVVLSHRHQMGFCGSSLFGADGELAGGGELVEGCDDGAGLGGVDAAVGHRR